ncbi:MAG: hypothetical protein IRZ11_02140, partial [Clostridia bacterium]|nr:hypothetical protein [Clostridia bacterium]
MGTLFVFVDGLGYAPAGPGNPLSPSEAWPEAHGLPRFREILGAPLAGDLRGEGLAFTARGGAAALALVDATLGLPGLPQSGTGQAALLGGFNAARLVGRHVPAFPTAAIRERLGRENAFLDALRAGRPPAFLNAFRGGGDEARGRHRPPSTSVVAFAATGLPFRRLADLAAGRAVAFDITGEALRGDPLPGRPGRPRRLGPPEPTPPAADVPRATPE